MVGLRGGRHLHLEARDRHPDPPQRNPAIAAKEIATLDRLSGGRVLLGVGVGWLREEFEALGVPFEDRAARTDAAITAMRRLWSGDPVDVDDGFQTWRSAVSLPTPTRGAVPIVIGGHSDAAARRAGRLGDGFFPGKGDPERLSELVGIMRATAQEEGRDPDVIEVTAAHQGLAGNEPMRAVEELAAIGVTRMIVPTLTTDPAAAHDVYGAFAQRIIGPANS
ncbi:MAG: TIGR03619 family F420-dependent LLM class oxidoreductase [Microthrixaceae bacterium]